MKTFLVDTNIILDDYKNIFILSEGNENTLVITETILKELDKYKYGNESINFNAREFIRLLNDSKAEVKQAGLIITNDKFNLLILNDIEGNFECNDDRIIETGDKYLPPDAEFISNDIIFRTKCFLKGRKAYPLKNSMFSPDIRFILEVITEEVLPNKEFISKDELESLTLYVIEDHITFVYVTDFTGNLFVYIRDTKNMFRKIDLEQNLNVCGIKPKNLEQRLLFELLLDEKVDISIIEAKAGTGKTLLALASACRLIDKGKYNKITYIRKTIISGGKQDEIGFLPGELNSKIAPYIQPLRDNIELIVQLKNKKKKKWTFTELKEAVEDFENKYNINYEYQGHLRGRTLEGIIILDEASNFSIQDITLILSRIREGSKVFILGSIKQIDNPMLNRYNNALTFLMNNVGEENNLKVRGLHLDKVERGKIVDWIEKLTN